MANKGSKKAAQAAGNPGGNGRGRRGPSGQTVEKQLWVIEQLQANPKLTINDLMQAVREKFETMLSFDRTKEAKAAFEGGARAIEQLRKGEFQGSSTGRRTRGGSTSSGGPAPQYMVATKRRSRWQFDEAANERDANRLVQELVAQGESPAVYRRVDLKVAVRIGR